MCCLFCKKRDCEPSCAQQTCAQPQCAQPACPQPACIPQPTCGPQPIIQPLCAQPVNECQVPTYELPKFELPSIPDANINLVQSQNSQNSYIIPANSYPQAQPVASTQLTQYPIQTSQQIPSTQYIEAQPAGGIQTNNQFNLTYNYSTPGIADNNLASVNYGESLSYPNTSPANYNLGSYGFTNQANGGLSDDVINSGNGQSYVPYGPTSPGLATGNGQSIGYGTYGPSNQPGDMTGTSYGSFGPTSQGGIGYSGTIPGLASGNRQNIGYGNYGPSNQVDPYCQTYNITNNASGQPYAGNYAGGAGATAGAANINFNVNMNGANGNNLFSSSTNKQETTTHIKKRSKRSKPKIIVHKMDADDESGEDELIARITVNY